MISSKTTQYRVMFPRDLNNNGTLFGGLAMQWLDLDEVAYITATLFSGKKIVTVSVCKVNFIAPVLLNTIVEISSDVQKVGSTKMEVLVEIYQEDMYSNSRNKVVDATFIFAAVDEDNKPIRLMDSKVEFEVKNDLI
ncbi:MAG TPA: acyl-CoA thioesterase [Bacteroidales bacterium]|nr:acyl-CoA thioesterase [Bacteroidales bacterium]